MARRRDSSFLREYHEGSRRPSVAFAFLLPLLVTYEVGSFLLGGDRRNAAELVLKDGAGFLSGAVPFVSVMVFLGVLIVFAGMGNSYNQLYGTWTGSFLDLNALRDAAWNQLFGVATSGMPAWSAWLALGLLCGLSIWILSKRLEAYEVIR